MAGSPRVAYLNSHYPSVSHTFIEREIRALRERGMDIHTFSVRKPGRNDTLCDRHREEAAKTFFLLDRFPALALAQVRGLFTSPLQYVRAFLLGQRISPDGFRYRLWHIFYLFEAVKLAYELRRRNLDHIHVHMANNAAAVALLATTFAGEIRYSLSIHGSDEFYNTLLVTLPAKVDQAHFVRCISDYCRAQVMTWSDPVTAHRMHIVHCGLDVSEFTPKPKPRGQTIRFLAIGRLVAIKGFPVLLRACKRLTREGVDWKLNIIGDGPERAHLQSLVESIDLSERVTLVGAVGQDRIREYIADADALVLSSFMEGVPVVLMEAMAMEKPVIATAVGGIPELVEHGVSGLLVRPSSESSLGDALLHFALHPDALPAYGQAGRRKVMAEFTIDGSADELLRLFQQYLPATGPSTAAVAAKRRAIAPSPIINAIASLFVLLVGVVKLLATL